MMNPSVPPLLETKIATSPTELANYLRRRGKLFWSEHESFWVVTDYELAEFVLKSPDFSADRSSFFISRMPHVEPQLVGDFFGVVQKMMVTSDAPAHPVRRKFAALGIADHVLDAFRPAVIRAVDTLVSQAAGKRSIEFAADIAQPLPSIVLADLFCVAPQDRQAFYVAANNMTQFFGSTNCQRQEAVEANRNAAHLRDFFADLIAQRRKAPRQDFLSILLNYQETFGLDDHEVISQAANILVAGKVSTTDQICNNLYGLLSTEGKLDELRADPRHLDTAIEEFTRLDPAVNFVFRVAKQDIALGSIRVRANDVVFISIHAVNRDPSVFAEPDACRFDRLRNPHFSYGHGPHYCLGARLARIQMNALFGRMIQQFPNLSLDPKRPAVRKHQSLAFSGFESLPLVV